MHLIARNAVSHMPPETPLLEITNASIIKNGRTLLDHISLKIEHGEHTAILGANGSGKSTLMKLISFIDYPSWEERKVEPVRVFGESVWDVFELRKKIGIVSAELQHKFLSDYDSAALTSFEAVLTGFFAARELYSRNTITDEMLAAADHALERAGAVAWRDKPLSWLSTGEMRRVLIARALVFQPSALLLDEPCTGLDIVSSREFLEQIRVLAKSGVTVILVTHHVEEIIPEIANLVLIKDGKIFASGAKNDFCTSNSLTSLFDAPITVRKKDDYFYASHD